MGVSKVIEENNKRLEQLYKQSNGWLVAVSFNLSKDQIVAEELVAELYLYLAEKCNPALWYLNSFNLMYCHSFIKSRFLNKIKTGKRNVSLDEDWDDVESEYNIEEDERLERAYDDVIEELKNMERTKLWPSSKLYQLYAFDKKMTLERLAEELKLSKSTVYLHTKKAKVHLKATIKNPFKNDIH